MWSSLARELLAYGAADGAFQLSFAYTHQQLLRLSVHQRQALIATLRAAIYACLCRYVGSPLRDRSIVVGRSFLRVIAIGVAANLCASLARLPLRLWPELFTLAFRSRPTIQTKDALYMLGLIPLAEELFYRHASMRLSLRFSPVIGISLVAFFFASSHSDQSSSSVRFFRSWYDHVAAS